MAHLVPLIVVVPGADLSGWQAGNARHIDVMPTLLDLLGIADTTTRIQGRSLFADTRQLPAMLHSIGVTPRAAVIEDGVKKLCNLDSGETWSSIFASTHAVNRCRGWRGRSRSG